MANDKNITDESFLQTVREIVPQQLEESMKFKQPRMAEIRETEDVLAGKKKPALRNRFNVPFDTVVMRGAHDTILAKSDDKVMLTFEETAEEHKRSAMKVSASFEKESGDDAGRWSQKDRLGKSMAFSAGRAIFETFSEGNPKYRSVRKNIDHYDFQCEPGGGPILEHHLFCGTINNFLTKERITEAGNSGRFISSEATKLINGYTEEQRKITDDEFRNKQQRYQAMGLDLELHNYVGQSVFNLVKFQTTIKGKRYYVLFDPKTLCILRCVPLEVMFGEGPEGHALYSYTSWATHESNVFWQPGYGDSYRPIAEVYRVLVNQMLENIQKRNWNMRGYDPTVVTDPDKLLYTPDGRVKMVAKPNSSIEKGIVTFETPDTVGVTLNSMEWLNQFTGQNLGVTPGSQGAAEESKVGIYYGNIEQISDRFGLLNKSYTQEYIDAGLRYDIGLYENLPEKMMVKIVGIEGIGWEEIKREDVSPEFTVKVKSTAQEARMSTEKAKKQAAAITMLQNDPELRAITNKNWRAETILRFGEFDEENIRRALDAKNDGTELVLARAAEMIAKIVKQDTKGDKDFEMPPLVRQATTGFMQKISDYADDHFNDLKPNTYFRLMTYAMAHKDIVMQNMTRRALFERMMAPQIPTAGGKPGIAAPKTDVPPETAGV